MNTAAVYISLLFWSWLWGGEHAAEHARLCEFSGRKENERIF